MRSLSLLLLGVLLTNALAASAAPPVPLTAGLKIAASTKFVTGNYALNAPQNGALEITGKNFTLDLKGVRLFGGGKKVGVGIAIHDAQNVTLKNATVSGYLWGVRLERCVNVRLVDCVSSWNGDLPPGTVIDESGSESEDKWGGGFLIRDSSLCRLSRCKGQFQWDGVDVIRSSRNVIESGDFSFNGNWGVHFWGSSNNTFRNNRAIWCTTGSGTLFQALTGWQTYDAQAVGIDHASNENLIEGNDLRFSGDGVFIRANEGPITPGTVVPVKNGSHRNILRNNDCSFSPNNAIEVDFVEGTIIEGNNCSLSNYGLWLGYSIGSVVRNNICIDNSTCAVEIENGQEGRFERNIFGYSKPRENGRLVYLRQNGRDKTPSRGYVFRENIFYGARTGVHLQETTATFSRNRYYWENPAQAQPVRADQNSQHTVREERVLPQIASAPTDAQDRDVTLIPGERFTLKGDFTGCPSFRPVVQIEDVPAWVLSASPTEIVCMMPEDYWTRPAERQALMQVFDGERRFSYRAAIAWRNDTPRIERVFPASAQLEETITVSGANLSRGVLRLNNEIIPVLDATPERLRFRVPEGLLVPTRFNLLYERGEGLETVRSAPVVFRVDIPTERQPHLLSATFSPKELRVGELLTVTFQVRNNLPTLVRLTTSPTPPFTYDERQAFWELGSQEERNRLHLRVTSDRPGGNHPGSWPYLFGFAKETLAPGETTTVKGVIRVQTAGEIEFRVGLVAGGIRFIDDNAFRTKIVVRPR